MLLPLSCDRRKTQSQQSNSNELLILPMLFAALRAIVQALPSAGNLPEVQAFFALEPLLASSKVQVGDQHGNN